MSTVESRIVTMKFDNASFEKGAADSLKTLDRLKQNMNFSAAGRTAQTALGGLTGVFGRLKSLNPFAVARQGIDHLSSGVAKFNLGNMEGSISSVNKSFIGMATVGITALSNLTSKAMEAGTNIVKSLTVSPITGGLEEYETNLNSIQTILANTKVSGAGLNDVNKALDELNHYSDKTIYNFSEMARNIGTFTAAGVDLDTSVASIKGIANLAALSGSNSQQAATAMYQLSQEIAAGRVSLMGWNSVVNAGMGGSTFQRALAETAVAMGEIDSSAIKLEGKMKNVTINGQSFRDSIMAKPGEVSWLSKEVLTGTLKQFTNDMTIAELKAQGFNQAQAEAIQKTAQIAEDAATKVKTLSGVFDTAKEVVGSGWAKTWQLIFGDFKEARSFFTGVSNGLNNILQGFSNKRNEMFAEWKLAGGRDIAIEALTNAFYALKRILGPIGRAFRDIFPRTTGEELVGITESLRDFTKWLQLSKPHMQDIRSIFGAIFGVLGVGWEVVKGVLHYFTSLLGLLVGGSGGLLDFSGSVAEVVKGLTEWILKGDYIKRFFDKIIAGRAALLGPIIDKFSDLLSFLAKIVDTGADAAIEGISRALAWMAPYLPPIREAFVKIGDAIQNYLVDGMARLQKYWPGIRAGLVEIGQNIKVYVLDNLEKLKGYWPEVRDGAIQLGHAIQDFVVSAFDKLKPVLEDIRQAFANAFGSLSGLGGGVGKAFGSLAGLFDIGDSADKAASGIDKVKAAFSGAAPAVDKAKDGIGGFLGFIGNIASGIGKVAAGLAAAIAWIIEGNVKMLSSDSVTGFIGGFIDFIGNVISGLMDYISNMNMADVIILLHTIIQGAIGAGLARIVWNIGGFIKQFKDMMESFTGVTDAFKQGMGDIGKAVKTEARADLILKMGIALGILAVSIYILSKIDAMKLAQSMAAVAAMLIMIVYSLKLLEDAMPADNDLKDSARLVAMSTMLMGLGLAMLALAGAVYILGKLDPGQLYQGLAAMGLVLAGVVGATIALNKMGGAASIIQAAIAIGILAVSMTMLVGAILLYNSIDINTLFEGGGKIAMVLLMIGAAMRAFPAAGAIAAAAAMLIMSVALTIISKALMEVSKLTGGDTAQALIALGGALLIMAIAANAMQEALPGAAAILVTAVALAVLAPVLERLGNMSLWEITKALIAIAGAILVLSLAAAALVATGVILAIAALGVAILILGVGLLAAGTGMFLFSIALMNLSVTGSAAVTVMIDVINKFLEAIPGFIKRLGASLRETANQIAKSAGSFINAGVKIMTALLKAVQKVVPEIGKTFRVIIAEALKTLRAAIPDMIRTGFAILMAFLKGLDKNIGAITQRAVNIIVKFINGISSNADRIVNAGERLIVSFGQAILRKLEGYRSDLKDKAIDAAMGVVDGFVGGLESAWHRVTEMVDNLIQKIPKVIRERLGLASPSKVTTQFGEWTAEGMANGIGNRAHLASREAEGMAKGVMDSLRYTMRNLSDASVAEMDLSPTITPVLDLTRLQNEATRIGTILDTPPITTGVSYSQASEIAADQRASQEALYDSGEGGDIIFEQHNHSPRPIDEVTTYRNTKSLISFAKEALDKR